MIYPLDFFLRYIASADKTMNSNYLGPASINEMAMYGIHHLKKKKYIFLGLYEFLLLGRQIVNARGPSGPNRDYLFHLESALLEYGGSLFLVKVHSLVRPCRFDQIDFWLQAAKMPMSKSLQLLLERSSWRRKEMTED